MVGRAEGVDFGARGVGVGIWWDLARWGVSVSGAPSLAIGACRSRQRGSGVQHENSH